MKRSTSIFLTWRRAPTTKNLSWETQSTDPNDFPRYHSTLTPNLQTIMATSKGSWRGIAWDFKSNAEVGLDPLQKNQYRNNSYTVTFAADGRFALPRTMYLAANCWCGTPGLGPM